MAAAVESPPQSCACKGVRFCALCETSERVQRLRIEEDRCAGFFEKLHLSCLYVAYFLKNNRNRVKHYYRYAKYKVFVFDHTTGKAFHCPSLNSTSSIEEIQSATNSCSSSTQNDDVIDINGLMVVHDFLSESEEADIIEMIDGVEWVLSQSGRRKQVSGYSCSALFAISVVLPFACIFLQDYGPKVNFKHKKVKTDTFVGMPEYADMLLEKMRSVSQEKLGNYVPFEMCNLEYDESKKSAIEMHFDDTWIWGNRLISINLLSGSVMTLANEKTQQLCYAWFPRRSLLCMADDARYEWKHAILAHHIRGRRIALTMREPSLDFQEGGELYEKFGKKLIALSSVRVPLRKTVS
ncbi:hypothetical protein ANCCEY_08493 [Ancylostoma ceylanicum]|uniref:Uncharacterized protein n=1 Tax=Ancylostoma ceylanicum TaxID=53326 RepID=A0A0D6LXS5_9BILA|nr:hypothetical protein ANCCEY_08493 [Ancylostoma ceylanicum]